MDALGALFPFALILAAFYLLIIRPARTRSRAAMQLQERVAPGLQVMTTAGIHGRVVAVEDDVVAIEVAPGVTIRFAKAAVGRIVTEDSGSTESEDVDDTPGDDKPSR